MDKQQVAQDLAEEILTDIELQRLQPSEVILKASRLARLTGRADLTTFLEYEREGYPNDGSATVWLRKAGRAVENDEDEPERFYFVPHSRLESLTESNQSTLVALQGGGNYSGEWASIAGREHDQKIQTAAAAFHRTLAISKQVVVLIYAMVAETYHELVFSQLQSSLFSAVQSDVDGTLAEAGGDALKKIDSVSARLRDSDPESVSQALTTCRRLIDSTADHLFPARDEPYLLGEQPLKVGSSNTLNRIQAFVADHEPSKGRRDRLRHSVQGLYERCSKGTHAEVSIEEARFLFLQTYVVLGEILALQKS
ncbi:AbiTii domain-containing protein [Rhodococcoides fascians]|uniref:AbiTii domain-containing protein n=1 Tax=Rhodococcoides fascians TaxID=1828 RepID=UPI00050C9DE0|nr:hypothetical protein [Rhodococcus fascians]